MTWELWTALALAVFGLLSLVDSLRIGPGEAPDTEAGKMGIGVLLLLGAALVACIVRVVRWLS